VISQMQVVKNYFLARPLEDVHHNVLVPEVTKTYLSLSGKVFADPDRAVRTLFQQGFLIKVRTGVYRYDPAFVSEEDRDAIFTTAVAERVKIRDQHRCVVCGRGPKEGMTLHVDHIIPRDKGGKGTFENGQTLCSQHNMLKKNYGQLEFGSKVFSRLLSKAIREGDERMEQFCLQILEVYKEFGLD